VLPGLVDPESIALLESGLTSKGGDDGFTNSPPRAAVLRWFSWKRTGFVLTPDAVLLRSGAIWRRLVVVPLPRAQGISLTQGPLERRLRLASINVHTVAGPVSAKLGAIDSATALQLHSDAAAATIASATNDTTHRWGVAAAQPASAPVSPAPLAYPEDPIS
jgi:putative membrane protein